MGKYIERVGEKFGTLTVIGYLKGSRINNVRSKRICKCDCGNQVNKTDKELLRNKKVTCDDHPIAETKICSICKKEKKKSEFHKLNTKKIGVQTLCKQCTSLSRKTIYWSNHAAALERLSKSRNKPSNIAQRKVYYESNKDKYKARYISYTKDESKRERKRETSKKYRSKSETKDKERKQKTEYYKRPEVIERRKQNHQKRKETDIQYNIKRRLRFRLRNAVRAIGNKKLKFKSALELLGCDLIFFKSHIESQFTEGMSWDVLSKIDIDHIKPCAKFDLTKLEEQRKCFHFSNLQPLWHLDNMEKGTKYVDI